MDRQGFTGYLEGKNFAAKTITNHIKYVGQFFARIRKEDIQVTKPDILKFLEYLKNKREIGNAYRRHYLDALNHYFTFLYHAGQTAKNPCMLLKIRGTKRKTLYKTYTGEELDMLFDNYYQCFVRGYDNSHIPKNMRQKTALSNQRNALLLSILIYQGATTREIERICTGDIDLIKATIKIQAGRHSNERVLPLKATQIGLLMHYLQTVRPQLLEYQVSQCNNEKLFLSLLNGSRKKTGGSLDNIFVNLSKQLKSIDSRFQNFKQVRASVISLWIKTLGLRKAQYMAGHRYISSTESYQSNNLDGLIDDINKLHPF
jgi:site-specific recombinase XerD